MPRTDNEAVTQTISTSLTETQIDTFITDANIWVTEELGSSGLGADRLEACALIRLRDLGLKSAKFDDISEQYQVDPEMTDYMKHAAAFDSTGTVRRYFMAPKDVRFAQWRVGQSYQDEADEVSEDT
jgi:hypothetical protein